MAQELPRAAKSELQKGLGHCGACRLWFEGLRDAGIPVDDEMERLEAAQRKAEALLDLDRKLKGG